MAVYLLEKILHDLVVANFDHRIQVANEPNQYHLLFKKNTNNSV